MKVIQVVIKSLVSNFLHILAHHPPFSNRSFFLQDRMGTKVPILPCRHKDRGFPYSCVRNQLEVVSTLDLMDQRSNKSSQIDTRIIFTAAVATDRQRHEDQEYSSLRAHCKCNDPGIWVFGYLCLCSFLQCTRTRPWWHLSICWWRQKTRTWQTHPWLKTVKLMQNSLRVDKLNMAPTTGKQNTRS